MKKNGLILHILRCIKIYKWTLFTADYIIYSLISVFLTLTYTTYMVYLLQIPDIGIYDTIKYILPYVTTICTGFAASMSVVLLVAEAKNKWFTLPYARVIIHQLLQGSKTTTTDMEITMFYSNLN